MNCFGRRQVSLRNGLLLLTLVCTLVGWYANRVHHRRRVVQWVERGGSVEFTTARSKLGRRFQGLTAHWLPEYWWQEIEHISLLDVTVAADDLRLLRYCRDLKRLDLDYCQLDAVDVANWPQLKQLEWLDLERSGVTNADLAGIGRFSRLESLILDANPITDDAVAELVRLSDLRYLRIRETQISQQGLADLQRALPNCRIVY